MDGGIAVQGLEVLWPDDLPGGEPQLWRPNAPGMKPEPHMLRLQVQYQGEQFDALMARSPEGHRQIAEFTERDRREFDQWVSTTPGWWVRVSSPLGGSMFSSPYATLEAAILCALSIPRFILWSRSKRKEKSPMPWGNQEQSKV